MNESLSKRKTDIIDKYTSDKNESPEWINLKINKSKGQTHGEQCTEKRRPHIPRDNIYLQIPDHCTQIYEGTF